MRGKRRQRRTAIAAVGMAFVLLVATPALAITWGQFDGDGHPNVGAMVVDVPETGWWHVCSGTLIEDDVFLTAAHCTQFAEAQELQVGVSFDPVFDPETSAIIRGTTHTHPDFGFSGPGGTSDAHDIAVIVLDEPAAGISPASLPTAGLLDQLNVGNGLKDQLFTVVGYGVQEPEFGEGPPVHPYTGERRVAVSRFLALLPSWLQLSQVDARDDGGSCFGDSGGPTFLGAGAQETDIVVSITSWGDSMCVATGTTYRVDTESARAFLAQFVTLP